MNESDQAHLRVKPAHGVGASLLRKEDERFMTGRGVYVGDIRLPGMLDVAFVRSPVAHGRLGANTKPARLHDGRPDRRAADPRVHQPAGLQALRTMAPGPRQGAAGR
jgi:hypothetical protein